MSHPAFRAIRAGSTFVLLVAVLGSASGARDAVPAAQPAPAAPVATRASAPAPLLIPCASGTCELHLHAAAARTPLAPPPPTARSEQTPYVLTTR